MIERNTLDWERTSHCNGNVYICYGESIKSSVVRTSKSGVIYERNTGDDGRNVAKKLREWLAKGGFMMFALYAHGRDENNCKSHWN